MSRIIQPGKGKSFTKHDINRALNNLQDAIQFLNVKIDQIDGLFSEFIDFLEKRKEFKEFLDAKHQQRERKSSGRSSSLSK
jgi:hypothetical protein